MKFAPSVLFYLIAAAAFGSAGCGGTASKLAEPKSYDVSKGDYLTEKEYKDLSKDEAQAYCEQLAQEIDIQNDNASVAQSDLADIQSEIESLKTQMANLSKPPPQEEEAPPSGELAKHTVVSGDWLSKLARTYYDGNWRAWTKIYEANRDQIKNPNLIYPRQVFSIPR
ncbi:MAG TPA: LysM peptidoglycan-binding domain-containing protein [bacterium]|nr:LysM peptidoglycan-binding domain-containing protein [bacterium]